MTTHNTAHQTATRQQKLVRKAIRKATFCTLATTSPAGRPHVAGVVYEAVDGDLWVHTLRTSRKARSVSANGRAAVCIPFRGFPMGPPYTIHFQASAAVVDMADPAVRRLLDQGMLKSISGHGALEMDEGCFLRIEPLGMGHSFGLGVKIVDLIRDPIGSGARSVDLTEGLGATPVGAHR